MPFDNQVVLITGATGSFGNEIVRQILAGYKPAKIIVFSRDELKQYEMSQRVSSPDVRYFLGDVRDKDRLYRAFQGVDIVIHAAAQKQVPAAEYNPFEAIQTNILGAKNIIDAAIDRNVKKVIALSSDKAANPINLYGATKLCADKLFIAGNAYASRDKTRFCVVRYGNVIGSRGSVVQLFKEKAKLGTIPITDERMTRFWITLPQAAEFVTDKLKIMKGGEIFIPKLPSMKITDLAKVIAPECKTHAIGIRPGEKLHEIMFSEDDAHSTVDVGNFYVIRPAWLKEKIKYFDHEKPVGDRFAYSSETNDNWLTADKMKDLLVKLKLL